MTATRELFERVSFLISTGRESVARETLKRMGLDDFDVEMQIEGVKQIMNEPLSEAHEIQGNHPQRRAGNTRQIEFPGRAGDHQEDTRLKAGI